MSITDKFNQAPDAQYAKCRTCDLDLLTEEECSVHQNATAHEAFAKGSWDGGHTVRILNPSRERRINSEVAEFVEEAVSAVMSKLEDLVYRDHITEAEAKEAIRHHMDFADAWEEYSE